jgi:cytochrome bd-type quinol oxidase subunit 2
MLAVDGAAVSQALAAAFFAMVAIAVLMLGFAAVCAVAGIRTLRAAPAAVTRWQRMGGVASVATAVSLLLAVGSMGWSWARYYLDGREADRASAAAARVAHMCESQFYSVHSNTAGHPDGFVPESEPPPAPGDPPRLVSHDEWVARCVVRNSKGR